MANGSTANAAEPLGASDEIGEDETVVTFEDALQFAIKLHQTGALEQAEHIYTRLLELDPKQPDTLQFLGVLRHNQGRSDEALTLMQTARELDPHNPSILINCGNVLIETGNGAEAVEVYESLLKAQPDNADIWNNMGVLLRATGQTELAEEALKKSLELDPQKAGAWHNLANLLLGLGRVEESVHAALKSVTLLPSSSVGRKLLGIAYAYLGETQKARDHFAAWLAEHPDDPTAAHHLAALEDRPPERASDAYVEKVFDDFAVSFDAKLQNLEYRAPQIVAQELAARLSPGAPVRMLDLGCGTGLCGPLVKAQTSHLTGVDLSANMLDRARQRGVYDDLAKAEFIAYLESVAEPYGAIIAADALCYVGQMERFSQNALGALEPRGVLIATFEANETGDPLKLEHTGRYTHSRDYLEGAFTDAGFAEITIEEAVLRAEQGRPVRGWVLCARRPAG